MYFTDTLKIQEMPISKDITFGDRILLVLEQQKKSKAWLAEKVGISRQAMNYLLNHSSTSSQKYVNEIAAALEIRPEWLLFGKGSLQNYSEADSGIAKIPIIQFNDIPLFNKEGNQKLITDFTHLISESAASCFATIIENPSMEPLFNRGTLLIFNSLLKPKNGDFVIFSIAKNEEVHCRQYFIDGKEIYLKAMDNDYTSYKNNNITIFGVLIESRNHFK